MNRFSQSILGRCSHVLIAICLAAGMCIAAIPTAYADSSDSSDSSSSASSSSQNSASGQAQCQAGIENYVTQQPWTNTLFELDTLHQHATGQNVTVAVIDSGVDTENPHLEGAVIPGTSMVAGDPSDGTIDIYNHGTAVAGIIAARPVEGSTVQGIAPAATIMPIRVFDTIREENGRQAGAPSMETVASAVTYAVDHGAKIINISLSDTRDIPEMQQAVSYAESHGSLIIASAGNRLTSASTKDGERYPAAYPEVIGVTALNTDLEPTGDSVHGDQVDIAAPGMQTAGTIPGGVDCVFATDAASSSFATAYVSGEAALVASAYPDESPAQWRQRILATANRTDPDNRSSMTGWGIMDPMNALSVSLSDNLRGPRPDGSTHAFQSETYQGTIVLHPVKRRNARTKQIVAITTISVLCLSAVVWIIGLRTRGGKGTDHS
ncbi:S8 family serine peptidase [Bifidobacterium colobi]|nr:S8 family serine peptidase [Bifidobacterium colobi]